MKKILAALVMAFAVSAVAAGPKLDQCSVGDVTTNALACFDASGNDANGTNGSFTLATQGLLSTNFDTALGNLPRSWFLLDKSDGVDGTQAVVFLNGPTTKSGVLEFDGPLFGSYALTLKAGNGYSAYLMNFAGDTSVAYDISKGLSHASLWTFSGDNSGGSCGIGNDVCQPIPEPGTWALMTAGLLGIAFISRRRKTALV